MHTLKRLEGEPEVFSVGDFCRRFNVSHTTFYAIRNRGDLPVIKLGRRTLVRRVDAERWFSRLESPVFTGGER